jgi:Cullin family
MLLSVRNVLNHCLTLARCAHQQTRIAQESDRVVHYLDARTRRPLLEAIESRLLAPHVTALLERGFAALMDAHRLDDLRRLYALLRRVRSLDSLKVRTGVIYVACVYLICICILLLIDTVAALCSSNSSTV